MVDIKYIDDYSPIYCGDTANPFGIQVLHKNGFLSILGATITMKMQNVDVPSMIKLCTGLWTISAQDDGRASYAYQLSDVNTVGNWYMWVKIVRNGLVVHPDNGFGCAKILVILPLSPGV